MARSSRGKSLFIVVALACAIVMGLNVWTMAAGKARKKKRYQQPIVVPLDQPYVVNPKPCTLEVSAVTSTWYYTGPPGDPTGSLSLLGWSNSMCQYNGSSTNGCIFDMLITVAKSTDGVHFFPYKTFCCNMNMACGDNLQNYGPCPGGMISKTTDGAGWYGFKASAWDGVNCSNYGSLIVAESVNTIVHVY